MPKKRTLQLTPIDFGDKTLGQRLARVRKECGFTQVELARRTGLIQSLVSDYETGRLNLSAEMAVRLALALDVSTDELLHPQAKKTARKRPDRKVLRRLELILNLPRNKQNALLTTIDAFLDSAAG